MKLFVTGGCGFIGSNFVLETMNSKVKKYEILNFDKITYAGNKSNLNSIKDLNNYSFVQGDICDEDSVLKTLMDFKPDAVIHFAAESHVDRSITDPSTFVNTNILGTISMLNASIKYLNILKQSYSAFKFIHISTDEVFGSLGNNGLFNEKTPYDPSSPYSASKASSDHFVRSWVKTYKFPAIITNCSNNYGPLQFPEKLIPLMIANCIDRKPLPIYGKGTNIRDWLFVKDHCKAINIVLEKGKIGETYNIGGGNELSNIEIVENICEIMNEMIPSRKPSENYKNLIINVEDRPGHDFRYAIDCSKIKRELNWKPLENFKTGLEKTINWYINNETWWRKIQEKSYNLERLGLIND